MILRYDYEKHDKSCLKLDTEHVLWTVLIQCILYCTYTGIIVAIQLILTSEIKNGLYRKAVFVLFFVICM